MSAGRDPEKNYTVEGTGSPPLSDHDVHNSAIAGTHEAAIKEAGDVYRDAEQAEQYGYVHRGYVTSGRPVVLDMLTGSPVSNPATSNS